MRLSSIAISLALSAALAACASSKGANNEPVVPQNNNISADPNMDCRNERPIGSSIARTNCESTSDRELDRKGAQEMHSSSPNAMRNGH